jgi:hypothetical protein
VAGLVRREPVLLLEDDEPQARAPADQLPADGQAEDPAADDADRSRAHAPIIAGPP